MRASLSPLLPAGIALSGVVAFVACRDRSGDAGPAGQGGAIDAGSFDKAALLRAFGDCATAEYRTFGTEVAALDAATAAATADRTPASLEAARSAWKTAMSTWERAELFQFGPAAISTAPGGRDMRDPIYSWPLLDRCLLEQAIVSKAYEAPSWSSTSLVSTRSLAAAEYLLFFAGADNACPADNAINANGTWAALGADELAARKLAYAHAVTKDLVTRAQALSDAWDPAKGNFIDELTRAGHTKSFTSEQMAFNAVTDAMFYLDLQAKNLKVGKPAGFVPDCVTAPCLGSVESPWAKRSKEHIVQNVVGYEKLFRGCGEGGAGLGFDDLLLAVGAEAVVQKVDASLAEIHAALGALTEPTFEDDIQKNLPGVQRLFDAFRANAAVMKSEVVSVLDLELPKRAEGDND